MANLFTQKYSSQQEKYQQKYNTSRINLLLAVVFTAINLFLLVINADSYFLFSAFIPYFITSMGMLLCGRFPEEYYAASSIEMEGFLDNSVFIILLVISIVITLLYLLSWFLSSKQRVGWLIFALVFFVIDTLGMLFLNGIYLDSILDILFHAWVIYYLIIGINAHYKLKKLNVETEDVAQNIDDNGENTEHFIDQEANSRIIRVADDTVKHRILLKEQAFGYDICYRRVKHTNELVIMVTYMMKLRR